MNRHALCFRRCHPLQKGSSQAAFTLIELMITVAIIGILSALAYPSYKTYIIRGYLADGPNGLSSERAKMEQFFQDNRGYVQVTGGAPPPCLTAVVYGRFSVQCLQAPTANLPNPPGPTYLLTATGSGAVAGFSFTIDQLNNRTTTAPAGSGWNSGNCWLTQKGQTCS